MYAYDSTIGAAAITFDIVEQKLNTDMENINDWCNANQITINTDKTKSMLVTTYQRYNKHPVKDLKIRLGGHPLEAVKSK